MAVLRIHGALGRLTDVASTLRTLDTAYSQIYRFLHVDPDRSTQAPALMAGSDGSSRRIYPPIPNSARPIVLRIRFASDGHWDILGLGSVLEVIRKGINDHEERKKDRAYRNEAEQTRLDLENGARVQDLLERTIATMRTLGLSEEEIRESIADQITRPLNSLRRPIALGIFRRAEVLEEDSE